MRLRTKKGFITRQECQDYWNGEDVTEPASYITVFMVGWAAGFATCAVIAGCAWLISTLPY